MSKIVKLLIIIMLIGCSKYHGYRGYGLKHDVRPQQTGQFIYTPLPDSSK